MSHVVSVAAEIKDLDALEIALGKYNAQLVRDARTFLGYGGSKQPCLHKITWEGARYEVGLRLKEASSAEPSYTLNCDFWEGHVASKLGENMNGLRNEYQAVVAERTLERRGWRVRREVNEQQHIRVVATR